jgi:tetratricopeptide (TPR) repeat protein/predicted Ser/Thr protein kinase
MRSGDVVADRFKVERAAGAGGMGTVYRCHDLHTGEPVAMKVLREPNEDRIRRFLKEAEVLFTLRHPRIVKYIAHGRTPEGQLFLVMEWLEGESLSQLLRRRALSLHDAYRLSLGACEALAVAHEKGVLHRDVKPGNYVLVEGDLDRVKLLDFGLARLHRSGVGLTQTGELLGTPGYMAPEQARGARDVDARADVFALGCVMFRCFTGRRAFEGDDALAVLAKLVLETPPRVSELRPGIPPQLDALVARMLAKQRDDRPHSGTTVLDELRKLESKVKTAIVGDGMQPQIGTLESMPSITVKEQRVMCLVLARIEQGPERSASYEEERVQAVERAVDAFGGHVDRLIDGTMLVTVPIGTPAEQAARAGRCAIAMRTVLGGVPVALAAGRGLVAAGALLGEAIDRAAGLLALHRGDSIRLDDAAAALMRDRFEVRRDDAGFYLHGGEGEDDHTRRLLGRTTSCVGRAREIASLEATFEECVREPVARAVLVTAPAGVGKSRVRYEFMRRMVARGSVLDEDGNQRPFQVWLGRGDPMSAGSAFGMIASAIRQGIGIRQGEAIDIRRRKLFDRISKRLPAAEQQRVAQFIGELIGTPFGDEQSIQLRTARNDPMLMGDQMRRAFEDLLAAECRFRPLMLVLEDLHWGDLPTVSFLDSALRNLAEEPFMILAFARPEVHELFPSLWSERDLQEVRLGRLTKKAAAQLVRQVLGDRAPDEVVDRLVDRAEGNAFYLEELIRAVAEGKGDKLPESVLAMVQSRLGELEGEARRVLRGASVFGQVFWRGGVAALVGRKSEDSVKAQELDEWLVHLQERELINKRPEPKFPNDAEYVFRHAIVQEAAYAMLTENDRELGHRLAGRWLEEAGEQEAVVLAEHFERGNEAGRAVRWYRRGAEQALEGDDLAGAIARAERGIACGASGDVLGELRLLQSEAHRWRSEFAEMEERARIAMQAVPQGSASWCRAVAESATACRALGHYDRLVKVAEELAGLRVLPHYEAAYTEAVARTAMQLYIIGWARHADGLIERIAPNERLLEATHPTVVAWIHRARSFGGLYRGDTGEYLGRSEAAAEWFEQAGDLRAVANARVFLGFALTEVGAYREAEAALRDALASAQRMGLHNVVATSLNNLGMALARLGHFDEGLAAESEAMRLAAAQGDRRVEGASRHYLAMIHHAAGDLVRAEEEAVAATEMLLVAPPLRSHALATLAEVRLAHGRADEALVTAREALGLLEQLGGIEEGEATVRLVYAQALHGAGEVEAARAAIAIAARRLEERAARIREPRWRDSFLRNVPHNARTIILARSWLDRDAAGKVLGFIDEDTQSLDGKSADTFHGPRGNAAGAPPVRSSGPPRDEA